LPAPITIESVQLPARELVERVDGESVDDGPGDRLNGRLHHLGAVLQCEGHEGSGDAEMRLWRQTLTTLELALPCSYARRAVLTRGRWETRETKSGESSSGRDGELDPDVVDSAGVGWKAGYDEHGGV
jgi:hypothetical protein